MPTSLATILPIASSDGSSIASSRCRSARRLGRGGMRIDLIRASTWSVCWMGSATVFIGYRECFGEMLTTAATITQHGRSCTEARINCCVLCQFHQSAASMRAELESVHGYFDNCGD